MYIYIYVCILLVVYHYLNYLLLRDSLLCEKQNAYVGGVRLYDIGIKQWGYTCRNAHQTCKVLLSDSCG
jgi:hypothetical protein